MQGMSPSLRHGPGIAFVRNKPMIIKFIDSVQNSSYSLLTRSTKFEVNFENYSHAYNAYIYFDMHYMHNKTRIYPWSKFFK